MSAEGKSRKLTETESREGRATEIASQKLRVVLMVAAIVKRAPHECVNLEGRS